MPSPVNLLQSDVRRALVAYHFTNVSDSMSAIARLRSIQFDPLAPVGCNHDLVLQARVPSYKVGDWEQLAYKDRKIYDGWDKQASLVPFEGWPIRRIFHKLHRGAFKKIFDDNAHAVAAILKEIDDRGPLSPKDCLFQERKNEWKGSWHGPNLSKQTLRALWHSGLVMTSGRRNGQHLYDLTERVVPHHIFNHRPIEDADALRQLVLERHKAVGVLRQSAPYEVWSYSTMSSIRHTAITELVATNELAQVDIEGVKGHATPEFLALLDSPALESRVVFIAPLDQFMWDRKMISHLFDFEYVWEVYVPEVKRKWGYYVLPVLYGDKLVGRVEFWCRKGVLEIRRWHTEPDCLNSSFGNELSHALRNFMNYCSASQIITDELVDPKIRDIAISS